MKRALFFALPLLFAPAVALAGSSEGSTALALSALVGERAPHVGFLDKHLLAAYLDGHATAPHIKGKKIMVKADAIDCRSSNVDITEHSCALTFGAKKIELHGRKAHELYATLVEAGVASDGAAGSIHEAVTNLDCVVDADQVRDKAGAGAKCTFSP